MANDLKTVKCGRCKAALEGPADPKSSDVLSCPRCGARDTLKNILAEVKKFVADKTMDGITGGIRGNKHLNVTTKTGPKRSYRFVVDL